MRRYADRRTASGGGNKPEISPAGGASHDVPGVLPQAEEENRALPSGADRCRWVGGILPPLPVEWRKPWN